MNRKTTMRECSKKTVILIFIVLPFFASCSDKVINREMTESVETVNIPKQDSLPSQLAGDVSFVKLQEPQQTFAEIDAMQVFNDTLYVFDRNTRNVLMSFDKRGNYLATFGRRGNAKSEYTRLWAFDVDKDYTYLYDRAKMKMMYFTHDGKFVKAVSTKFRGDAFKTLANGKFLFSMAFTEDLNKLCLVDNTLKIENVLLTYSDKDKDNLSNNVLFQRVGDEIMYNKELSDTVYVFSADDGECVKSYYMNFAKQNIPQEYKYDFEKLWDDGKDKAYVYIDDCPMVWKNLMVIPVSYKGKHGVVYYDLNGKKTDASGKMMPVVTNPVCLSDQTLVGWMEQGSCKEDTMKELVPADITAFLKAGGRVLVLGQLR